MPIPKSITADHVRAAAARIDAGAGKEFGQPSKFIAEVDGNTYAPKALVGIAAGVATGRDLSPHEFSSGEQAGQAVHLLRALGFAVRSLAEVPAPLGARREQLVVGEAYTRPELRRLFGVPGERGGDFDTGYVRVGEEWIIFANLSESRTGHEHGNHWSEERFVWFGKRTSSPTDSRIAAMLTPGAAVHLFTRSLDRDPFTYCGRVTATPADVDGSTPVRIRWTVETDSDRSDVPGEVFHPPLIEGAVKVIHVNAFERNRIARKRCINHWGTCCSGCGLDMGQRYGDVAKGYIHVHHLVAISGIGTEYAVNPVNDLRPLCPNCHAVVHLVDPPMSIEDLQRLVRERL
jgi:5-methylcytosine-specific restriction protein A